nr:Crp/Fnr family transcriptional regulator [Bacteroidota bacterium]
MKESCAICKDRSCAVSILNDSELELLEQNCSEGMFRKDEIIFHQGSIISHIVYVRTGLVLEYLKGNSGRNQIIQIVKNRSYLGLPSLFGDRVNNYSYKALEALTVCYIDINTFKNLIKTNGNFAYEILVSVCQDSLNSHHRFLNINAKQTFGKVADALLYFARVIFENNTFELSLTRSDIGALIGISRESTTRALNKFQTEGIIRTTSSKFEILKPHMLQKISESG